MAQVAKGTGNADPSYVSIPGYEVIDVGLATENIAKGDLVTVGPTGWSKCAAGALDAHGVAVEAYIAGQGGCDFLIQGEMDGYDPSNAVAIGTNLFPSASVAGGIQTDVVASAPVRMRKVNTGRIRFNFV
jgi:hypothetical protein